MPRSSTSPALVDEVVAAVEELEEGLLSVSAPVRDASGAVVAALASSTASGRSDVETLRRDVVPLVVRTAARISADLGHRVVPGAGREGFF